MQPHEKQRLRELLALAEKRLNEELFAGLLRVQTDPMGVRAEALAVKKVCSRLIADLTGDE